MNSTPDQFKKFSIIAARSADQKKAGDIVLLDFRKTPYGLSDYLLIASANSQVHLRALWDIIEDSLEKEGLRVVHRDGVNSGQWMVLDYGGLMVHLFSDDARKIYSPARLWEDAKKVRWEAGEKSRVKQPLKNAKKRKVPQRNRK